MEPKKCFNYEVLIYKPKTFFIKMVYDNPNKTNRRNYSEKYNVLRIFEESIVRIMETKDKPTQSRVTNGAPVDDPNPILERRERKNDQDFRYRPNYEDD